MSLVLNRRIQELLRKRLGEIGIAADLHNDDQIVERVCIELGIDRETVARQLDEMRVQNAVRIVGRDLPQSFREERPATYRAMQRTEREHRAATEVAQGSDPDIDRSRRS